VQWDFGYCGHYWPIVPAPDDRWWWLWRNWWNEDWQGKPKYSEKTCPSATLSTTNSTWLDPGLNQGRRGGKPATNRLSYGATFCSLIILTLWSEWTDRTLVSRFRISLGVWIGLQSYASWGVFTCLSDRMCSWNNMRTDTLWFTKTPQVSKVKISLLQAMEAHTVSRG
jgi:hypothetical protein